MKKIFLFSSAIFLFSCSGEEIKSYKGKELKTFSVKIGEKFSINLNEDHKAGQTWGIKTWDDAVIEYQKSNYNGEVLGTTDFIF
ncbi:MAG: hypothetical protein IAF38_03600, partial [Bacteroidia bacterium]|nr:hypothetical protein [Bacteroidia bacterium]